MRGLGLGHERRAPGGRSCCCWGCCCCCSCWRWRSRLRRMVEREATRVVLWALPHQASHNKVQAGAQWLHWQAQPQKQLRQLFWPARRQLRPVRESWQR